MPRSTENRASEARRRLWQRPNKLDAPTPPAGQHYRWVRAQTYGQDDPGNMSARLREGYEPVMASEHPDFRGPTIEDGSFKGCIGVGGLILAKIAKEVAEDRQDQMHEASASQMVAVDNDMMRVENAAMPTLFKSRKTTTTRGSTKAQFEND
jgi:hypothetical protein